jgi:hypothetical protein
MIFKQSAICRGSETVSHVRNPSSILPAGTGEMTFASVCLRRVKRPIPRRGIYNRATYAKEMREALERWGDHVEEVTK